ncbi:hypothetical protein [Akkermansia muciniphila]
MKLTTAAPCGAAFLLRGRSVDAADENNDGQNERKIMEMRIL